MDGWKFAFKTLFHCFSVVDEVVTFIMVSSKFRNLNLEKYFESPPVPRGLYKRQREPRDITSQRSVCHVLVNDTPRTQHEKSTKHHLSSRRLVVIFVLFQADAVDCGGAIILFYDCKRAKRE